MTTKLIDEQHLEWALCHLELFGGSDVFPPTHDFSAIRANWESVKKYIIAVLDGEYSPGTPYMGMSPKADGTFRAVHELNPIDSIIITAVVYAISGYIEKSRIPEDQRVIFSFRITPTNDGHFFKTGSDNWDDFTRRREELFSEFSDGWVLKADISDFYNQIYLHRIQNALEECLPAELEFYATFIHDFLNGLNSKISKGIPVGPAFSTVLAEAVLNDVDHRISGFGVKFIRWVDDFYIFHHNEWFLYNTYNAITEYLYSTHRLVFNASKTNLCKVMEFKEFLDGMEDKIVTAHIDSLREHRCSELLDELIADLNPYDHSELDWDDLNEIVFERYSENEAFKVLSNAYKTILQRSIESSNITLVKHVIKKCTAARIRSIYPILRDSLVRLLPVVREVAFYIRRVCNNDMLIEISEVAAGLCKMSKNRFTLRWMAYILTFPDYPSGHVIAEEVYSSLEQRDQLFLAMKKGDLYRIKSLRTKIEQLPDTDRQVFLLATSALTKDERDPILECAEKRGRLIDTAYSKYVRGGITRRRT